MQRDHGPHPDPDHAELLPLHVIGCDAFERALLPLLRDLMETCRNPDGRSWNAVYGAAASRWGARTGLPLAYGLARISEALLRVKGERLQMLDAADTAHAAEVTRDERLLLLLLHLLRRNHVLAGQDFLFDLTEGKMDKELMALALDFARRHSCGTPREVRHDTTGPHLRIV
ncbi:hypothetical protein [Paenirhodobacter populi]|uniref:hypothetical protein n=1 Tax=Paenirhodobacter populi TaxID=2306993 RepID=UPI001F4F6B3E|nr:hypothetical protein [Sinirhodobacter populi]